MWPTVDASIGPAGKDCIYEDIDLFQSRGAVLKTSA